MLLNILQGFIICQVIFTSLIFIYEFLSIVFFISTFFYSVLMNYYDLAIVSLILGIFLFWFDKKNNSRGKTNE